ncbi:serine/threonine protein kinase [bacterium]|nr:serine/threonine protein kinase [bacterium]
MSEHFAEYQLLTKIASGGMAEIFLAKHSNSPVGNMPFAIKKVLPHYSKKKEYINMFLSEARIICNINHENIVKIYDFGKVEGIYYIAMEYVFGQNLGSMLQKYHSLKTKIPVHIIFEIALAILAGLEHAHNAKDRNGVFLNVVHLDMNPNNILLGYEGKIKIIDFGIARASYKKQEQASTAIQGTYAYLSPEQCKEEELDRRSDIFSFGIILWEMLTGKTLFQHYDSDAVIIQKILNEPIPTPYSVDDSVSRYFSSIIMKALEKDREKRYATAADMLADIQKLQHTFEFDPDETSLPDLLRKNFASHYIKMTSLLEQSQKDHLMGALFDNMEEMKILNKTSEIKVAAEKIEQRKREEKQPFFTPLKIMMLIALVLFIGMGIVAYIIKSEPAVVIVQAFSQPSGAMIFVDGDNSGKTTPAFLPLTKGKSYIIEFRKSEKRGGKEVMLIGGITISPTKKNKSISLELHSKNRDSK